MFSINSFLSTFVLTLLLPLCGYAEMPAPLIEPPKELSSEGLDAFLEKQPLAAEQWYELAILQIKAGQNNEAQESLTIALQSDPHLTVALAQKGFLYLWNKNIESAYLYFNAALHEEACNKTALAGLTEVSVEWGKHERCEKAALNLLWKIYHCDPHNADTLYYLGRLLAKRNCLPLAERLLKEALHEVPGYADVGVALGGIYFRQKRIGAAKSLYRRFLRTSDDAKLGLAGLSLYCGDDSIARDLFAAALHKKPCDQDARQGLARSLANLGCYCQAEKQYCILLRQDPCNESYGKESLEVRSHTEPRLWLESSYVQAKENDPSVGVPVVRDFYFKEAFHLWLPLTEAWRFDLKQICNTQKEDDIFPPTGVNYDVLQNGLQATSQYFFAKDWRFDLSLRGFRADGDQNVFFPFDNTTRFEPGALLLYKSERQLMAIEGHTESFIIKNFSVNRSQLQMMNVASAGYGVSPDWPFKPEAEIWIGWQFYGDNLANIKNYQTFFAKFAAPYVPDGFFIHYFFEHSHFKALSPNYYSYKQQTRNTIGLRYRYDYRDYMYGEFIYEHRWQNTKNLSQPIGSFIFTDNHQMLIGNRYILNLGYRYSDRWLIELTGHYFRDTLPYRDWRVGGSILYQF